MFYTPLIYRGGEIVFTGTNMKLTNTKVNDAVKEIIGEDSVRIIDYLKDKKNVSDFKIAEKVDRDIHEVRIFYI